MERSVARRLGQGLESIGEGRPSVDWTPAVLVTAATALLVAAAILILQPWGRTPESATASLPPPLREELQVWRGEIRPGLLAFLLPVWGDPNADAGHDRLEGQALGLEDAMPLGMTRLLLFNHLDQEQELRLEDGLFVVKGKAGERVAAVSLTDLLERDQATVPETQRFVLTALGALDRVVRIPPRSMTSLVLPFAATAPLDGAQEVHTDDGTPLVAGWITRERLHDLMAHPSPDQARRLLR